MVFADPLNDATITDTIASFQRLGSVIDSEVGTTNSLGTSKGAITTGTRGASKGENRSSSRPRLGALMRLSGTPSLRVGRVEVSQLPLRSSLGEFFLKISR